MKPTFDAVECFRVEREKDATFGTEAGERFGVFFVPIGKVSLRIIASSGDDEISWEHVSVCARDYRGERCPNWDEMCFVKGLFWADDECVVQFHPPESEYINNHRFVLHLWKPIGVEMPRPPAIAVGVKGLGVLT